MTSALRQDCRIAVAQLRRRPGFVLGATLSLAIGMSLATALFSVMDAALLADMRTMKRFFAISYEYAKSLRPKPTKRSKPAAAKKRRSR